MSSPTAEEIEAIRERRGKIVGPIPWRQGPPHNADRVFAANGRNICSGMTLDGDDENHAFIANAPTDIDTLLAALDAVTAENKTLRTCFCIRDDETVVSSVEGSILIDSKTGTRRRYFTATDEERKLKEQLDAVTADRDRHAEMRRGYHDERQQLRGILRIEQQSHDGTTVAEFDSQPPLLDAARMIVASLSEVTAERDRLLESEDS